MLYDFNLSEEAENDLLEAFSWYEQQRSGLGEEFLKSIDKAQRTIVQSPEAYRIRYKNSVRGFVLDRFPFLILYLIEKQRVNVIAIFNTHRNPKTWKKRI